jgi:aminodeoxyfutalosine synthase
LYRSRIELTIRPIGEEASVADMISAGMTVTENELSALAVSHDILTIGMRADDVRRSLHGAKTTFLRVADLDVAPGASVVVPPGARELRIVGMPASVEAAVARVDEVCAAAGQVPVSAFSLADLEEVSAREQTTLRGLLERLKAAGLELVAEAPFDSLRDPCRSVEEVNIAGLTLARLTIHRPPTVDIPALLLRIAALQRQVAVIRAFAPLPRQSDPAVPTTGYDDIKRVALARLYLESVPSIQVDWSVYGPKLAQVALTVGADDVDGVSAIDDMSQGRRRAPVEEIERNIRAAGLEPVERNGRFDLLSR